MPILRLAYVTQFLIAVIAVFIAWSQVGGQSHLDLMPWYLKLGLGGGSAFTVVRATAAALEGQRAWNARTLRWLAILLLLLTGCGLSSYYVHLYGESDEEDENQDNATVGQVFVPPVPAIPIRPLPSARRSPSACPAAFDTPRITRPRFA